MSKRPELLSPVIQDRIVSWVAPGFEAIYLRIGHEVGYTQPPMIALGVLASVLLGIYFFKDDTSPTPSTKKGKA